jgi:hypothetical protein
MPPKSVISSATGGQFCRFDSFQQAQYSLYLSIKYHHNYYPNSALIFNSRELNMSDASERDLMLDLIREAVHDLIAKHAGKSIDELDARFSVEAVDTCRTVDEGVRKFLTPAYKGRCQLVVNASQFKGGGFKDYRSEVMSNPSWLDLAVSFEKSIGVTGDISHIYFEDFSPAGEINGVQQLVAFAGS